MFFSDFDGTDIKNAEFGMVTPDYYVLLPTGRPLYSIQICNL
jgi:hypothetical protein